MYMNLYVASIDYQVTESELKKFFEIAGKVTNVKIIQDKNTGNPKGFGFVTMPDEADAKKAIDRLTGQEINGRKIRISPARPRKWAVGV